MNKNVWVFSTFLCGISLCIFGNSAFAAIGVVLGIGAAAGGVYFMGWFGARRAQSIAVGTALIVLGLTLIILCIFIVEVAYFLGGIILAAAGVVLLLICGRRDRLVTPLSVGCLLFGIMILFMPSFIGWLTVVIGISLVIYSGFALVYMY